MNRLLLSKVMLLLLVACQSEEGTLPEREIKPLSVTEEKIEISDKITESEVTVTIGAIGDVLLHGRVYNLAETESGYDFLPMLENVKPLLEKPDFMMANQESMPGGIEIGLSTYPTFNSPKEIVSNLQELGIDMVIGANNHTIDRGVKAVESALDFYDEIGMEYVGVYRDSEDRNRERIVDVNTVSLGILSYTYGTNGIPLPEGHEDIVALIDQEKIEKEVKQLREKVDVVIVHMHWGAEYEREPNEKQRQLADKLSEAGVDIIFGHHPHVVQPIDVIKQEDGHETTVFYSLGNFLSGQTFDYTDIGGVATVEVTKKTKGEEVAIEIQSPYIEPTIVLPKEMGFRVYPFAEVEEKALNGSSVEDINRHVMKYLSE
ncbi:CapA family protein [Halalkalibacter akibai]|uniref:Capsule synthesis protein CapA domain-containing protein n=1 Tax=Halalkalibacter akibai (strain ATCC 43226 / DSM 21942 / CIP 109018 / JCM 9157 / 1139) TaxID=1236973 RepID=W4QS97_HALA3|nr:CapA family protein [Halalkalibacter akibai]GAE34980.1 hypothetical protein JCM9157_2069 [Halalkalibacter akibai JCM 9157]